MARQQQDYQAPTDEQGFNLTYFAANVGFWMVGMV